MCTVCMCSIFATTHEPNWTCCKHSDQNLYNTSNARCKLNYIKYKYELVSQMEDGTISHASSSSNDACSVRRETCVCVWVCAKIANKADKRGTFQGAAAQVKVTFRCAPLACVCVVLLEGIGYTPTDRPTARYVKIVYMGTWNMICQAPSKKRREDITRIKYSFYALGFISSTYVQCIP